MIEDIDKDSSGSIDFDEFLDMMTAKMVSHRYLTLRIALQIRLARHRMRRMRGLACFHPHCMLN